MCRGHLIHFGNFFFNTYLLQGLGFQKYPTKLNNLGRIFRDIDAMLVASGSDVDYHEAVKMRGGAGLSRDVRHDGQLLTRYTS